MDEDITKVEPMDPAKKNSRMINSVSGESTVQLDSKKFQCYWNDAEFSEGSKVCDNGIAYECHMGSWLKLERGC